MIKLQIPKKEEPFLELIEKLTSLALAHQVSINKKLKAPVLTDGTLKQEGAPAILDYLNDTEKELEKWWYCAC